MGTRGAEGRSGDEAGGYQLTRELRLQEIGEEISAAAKELTWRQRKDVEAGHLEYLRKPVGKLGRKIEAKNWI